MKILKINSLFFMLLAFNLPITAANNLPKTQQPPVINTPAGSVAITTPPPVVPGPNKMPTWQPPTAMPPSAPAASTMPNVPPVQNNEPTWQPPKSFSPVAPANQTMPTWQPPTAMPPSTPSASTMPNGMPGAMSVPPAMNASPVGLANNQKQGLFNGEPMISKHVQVNQAHADPAFRSKVEGVWKNKPSYSNPRAHLSIDASSVIIRGEEQDVIDLENYIVSLDKPVVQVRVDAIILFAQRNYNFDIGIDWSGIYNRAQSIAANSNPFGFVGLGGTLNDIPVPTAAYNSVTRPNLDVFAATTSSTVDTNLLVNPNNFALNLFTKVLTQTTAVSAGNSFVQIPFVFGGADLNLRRLNLVLNAAESESKVKIVSRPSVLTGSGNVATVNIGQQLPMQQSSINQGTGTIYKSGQVVYKSVGISLTVTPTVGSDNKTITLNIKIGDIEVVSGTTQSNNDGIMTNPPLLSDLSVVNTVVLKSGQTTVIGGLATRSDRKTTNRIPLLYRIPVVGNLFQASLNSDSEMEQFIFITPTIVEENIF